MAPRIETKPQLNFWQQTENPLSSQVQKIQQLAEKMPELQLGTTGGIRHAYQISTDCENVSRFLQRFQIQCSWGTFLKYPVSIEQLNRVHQGTTEDLRLRNFFEQLLVVENDDLQTFPPLRSDWSSDWCYILQVIAMHFVTMHRGDATEDISPFLLSFLNQILWKCNEWNFPLLAASILINFNLVDSASCDLLSAFENDSHEVSKLLIGYLHNGQYGFDSVLMSHFHWPQSEKFILPLTQFLLKKGETEELLIFERNYLRAFQKLNTQPYVLLLKYLIEKRQFEAIFSIFEFYYIICSEFPKEFVNTFDQIANYNIKILETYKNRPLTVPYLKAQALFSIVRNLFLNRQFEMGTELIVDEFPKIELDDYKEIFYSNIAVLIGYAEGYGRQGEALALAKLLPEDKK